MPIRAIGRVINFVNPMNWLLRRRQRKVEKTQASPHQQGTGQDQHNRTPRWRHTQRIEPGKGKKLDKTA